MHPTRISQAIDNGDLSLPADGTTVVFNARADSDLSCFDKERTRIVQGFWPDHDALTRAGFDVVVTGDGSFDMGVVFLPRAKVEARALVAQALRLTGGGPVIVDGQKTDGIESIQRDCRKRGGQITNSVSKAHGKMFVLRGGEFSEWDTDGNQIHLGTDFVTVAGVFSADAVDPGSAALVQALPSDMAGRVCDLGAGWGYLSHHVLTCPDVSECHLIEAQHSALECARQNVSDPRARFHWGDATTFRPDGAFETVVMNPPFHNGRASDPTLGQAFIAAAAAIVKPHGTVWLVANRHLPYEAVLTEAFHEVVEVGGDKSFKVFRATKPRRKVK
jgi:16S rRNA (guanine1207-N2)-methyltransferase